MLNTLNPYLENKYLSTVKLYIYNLILIFFFKNNTFLYKKVLFLKKKLQLLKKLSFLYIKNVKTLILIRNKYKIYSKDFIYFIFNRFTEINGDKCSGDDNSIITGFGTLNNKSICIVAVEKGIELNEKIYRNFGSVKPEGYKKILRIFLLSEKFKIPILIFIDTPGAYPGAESEERLISITISNNIRRMGYLKVPTISLILGEGGSGGALGMGVTDYIMMLQYSYYSVISPEGCSSIIWKDNNFIEEAANGLKLNSINLKRFNIINFIISENIGGSSLEKLWVLNRCNIFIYLSLYQLYNISVSRLLQLRNRKFRFIGKILS